MRTTIAIILGLSMVIAAAVFGNYFYRSRSHSSTIRVVGSASRRFDSDVVKWRITVGRTVSLADARVGYAQTRAEFESVLEFLRAAGVPDTAIQAQPLSRNYSYDNSGNVIGYTFQQSLFVVYRDVNLVEKLALDPETLAARGIAPQFSSLEYYLSGLADIKRELLAEATRDAKARAVEIASNAGARIGSLIAARSGVFQITEPFSTEVSDYGIYSTTTRQKDVTITVTTEFRLR